MPDKSTRHDTETVSRCGSAVTCNAIIPLGVQPILLVEGDHASLQSIHIREQPLAHSQRPTAGAAFVGRSSVVERYHETAQRAQLRPTRDPGRYPFAAILEAAACAIDRQSAIVEFRGVHGVVVARHVRSAAAFQGQRAIIVMGDTYRDRLVLDAFPQSPLIEYTIAVVNASLAAMNMNLAAEALGCRRSCCRDGAHRHIGCGLSKAGAVLARWSLSVDDDRLRLPARIVSAAATQTPTRSDLLRESLSWTRSRRHGGLAGADEGGLQGQPPAILIRGATPPV